MTPQAIRGPPETPDPGGPGIPAAVQLDDHRAAAGVEDARYYIETAQPITPIKTPPRSHVCRSWDVIEQIGRDVEGHDVASGMPQVPTWI
jgi:hypothetical protein